MLLPPLPHSLSGSLRGPRRGGACNSNGSFQEPLVDASLALDEERLEDRSGLRIVDSKVHSHTTSIAAHYRPRGARVVNSPERTSAYSGAIATRHNEPDITSSR